MNLFGKKTGVLIAFVFTIIVFLTYAPSTHAQSGGLIELLNIYDGSLDNINTNAYGIGGDAETIHIIDHNNGFVHLDVTNPVNPYLIDSYDPGTVTEVKFSGSNVYILEQSTGLKILDLDFNLVGSHDLYLARTIDIIGSIAYVFDLDGLKLLDVNDTNNPILLDSYSIFGQDIQVIGNIAYIAGVDNDGGLLTLLDVSDPVNPTLLGSYDTNGEAMTSVEVIGNVAYIARGYAGLVTVDVSDPHNPIYLGSYDTDGSAKNVQVVDEIAYVADWDEGLLLLNVSDPTNIALIYSYDNFNNGLVQDIHVVDEIIYVAVGGIYTLEYTSSFNNCTQVTEISIIECEALVALYNSTDGDNWNTDAKEEWLQTITPCSWAGISCVNGGVRQIDKSGGGLIGDVPAEIGNLTNLSVLMLGTNQLSSVPPELGNLVNLSRLHLDANHLVALPEGMSNLANLTTLILFSNPLTEWPSTLSNLNLDNLRIDNLCEPDNLQSWINAISEVNRSNVLCSDVRIAGRLWDERDGVNGYGSTDQPLPGIDIEITRLVGNTPTTIIATTDEQGQYSVNSLPFTQHTIAPDITTLINTTDLTLSSDPDGGGDGESTVTLSVSNFDESAQNFVYAPPPTPTPIPVGNIGGFLIHVIGNDPVPGATIWLRNASGNLVDTTTTNSNGIYLFTDVVVGTGYQVFVDPSTITPPDGADSDPYDKDPLTLTSEGGIQVFNGQTTSVDALTVDEPTHTPTPTPTPTNTPIPCGDITGFATHLDGDPMPNVVMVLKNASDNLVETTTTASNGAYTFDCIGVGTGYSISIDLTTLTIPDDNDPDPYDKDPFTLVPVTGVSVTNNQTTVVENAVTVTDPTYTPTPTPTPTDTPTPTPTNTPTNTPIPCGDITGFATHLDGDPMAGVLMLLRNASGNLIETTTTAANGAYTFDCIGVGTGYSVSIDVTTLPPPDDDLDPYDKDPFTLAPITGISVTNNQVTVVDAVTVTDPTYTPTPTPTPTFTPTPTPTPTFTPTPITPTPIPDGDEFEMDDSCESATDIPTTGLSHNHTFHDAGDSDWIRFETVQGEMYQLIAEVPYGSSANVTPEVRASCDVITYVDQPFSNYAVVNIPARHTGSYWVKLSNRDSSVFGNDVTYRVSVTQVREVDHGAVIIVAGRDEADDDLQPNIHSVTDRVYEMFYDEGYAHSQIYYIATDAHPNNDPNIQVDYTATVTNFQTAVLNSISNLDQTDEAESLTIYMMSHGFDAGFYLDAVNKQYVYPEQLDEWLDTVQSGRPNLEINVIIDACYAGSFVNDPNETIAGENRVIIGSSPYDNVAWSSFGSSNFSDFFLLGLNQRRSIKEAFLAAQSAVSSGEVVQQAWINDNRVHLSEKEDVENADNMLASNRYLRDFDMPIDEYPVSPLDSFGAEPIIDPDSITVDVVGGIAQIQLSVSADPEGEGIGRVQAVLYPPSLDIDNPPTNETESPIFPTVQLTDDDGDGIYQGELPLGEMGSYQVAIYAQGVTPEQVEGVVLEARPVTQTFTNPPIPLAVGQTASQISSSSTVWLGLLFVVSMLCAVTIRPFIRTQA